MASRNFYEAEGLAVDLGGTKVAAARVKNGQVVETVREDTDTEAGVSDQVEAICRLLDRLDVSPEDRIGVAVAGRVNRDGEWFAVNSEILTRIDRVPLRTLLADRLGRDVMVQNDALAAAVGEFVAGAGKGCRSMAYVTVSTGVGGGIVLDGCPVTSPSGLAGHMGFTTSRNATGRCGSGRTGTVESIASGRAIAAKAATEGHPGLDGKQVFEAHLAGAPWAREIVQESASAIAELCANLKTLLDLDRIVLGGGIGLAASYLDLVKEALLQEPQMFRPELRIAALGTSSAMIGILAQGPGQGE